MTGQLNLVFYFKIWILLKTINNKIVTKKYSKRCNTL